VLRSSPPGEGTDNEEGAKGDPVETHTVNSERTANEHNSDGDKTGSKEEPSEIEREGREGVPGTRLGDLRPASLNHLGPLEQLSTCSPPTVINGKDFNERRTTGGQVAELATNGQRR